MSHCLARMRITIPKPPHRSPRCWRGALIFRRKFIKTWLQQRQSLIHQVQWITGNQSLHNSFIARPNQQCRIFPTTVLSNSSKNFIIQFVRRTKAPGQRDKISFVVLHVCIEFPADIKQRSLVFDYESVTFFYTKVKIVFNNCCGTAPLSGVALYS